MKSSELRKVLEVLEKRHGDLEVCYDDLRCATPIEVVRCCKDYFEVWFCKHDDHYVGIEDI